MLSPALLAFYLALACTITGTPTRLADHKNNQDIIKHQDFNEDLNEMGIYSTNILEIIKNNHKNIDKDNKIDDKDEKKQYDKINIENKHDNLKRDTLNDIEVIKDRTRKDSLIRLNGIYTSSANYMSKKIHKYKIDGVRYSMRQYNFNTNNTKKRSKRDADDPRCESFKLSNEGKSLTHPYSITSTDKLYFSNINCVTVLKAGEGQVVKLTFVDVFHIEGHENCEYDYLEIRDGQQGYANLLGKLCGEAFPAQITSTGPYIWLKFHSDETIEYEGFHINVQFETVANSHSIPEACNITMGGMHGIIDSKKMPNDCVSGSTNQALDVVWSIRTPENTKIYLNFTSYSLAKPNECEENVVQVFGYILEFDSKLAHYCGSMANSVTTKGDEKTGEKGNIMYIRMYASKAAKNSAFNATYTAFRTVGQDVEDKCDEETEFDCEDNTCIDHALTCDGYAHCRLKADEDAERCKVTRLLAVFCSILGSMFIGIIFAYKGETESTISKPHIMVILVIFSLILSGMSFVFLFKCIKKLYEDHKIIKEHIKNSREDVVNAMIIDPRMTLDAKKLQRDSEPRASLERDNHTNEMYKQQRKLSQRSKPASIDSDFIQETQLDLDDEPWRRDVTTTIEAQDIKIERNGRSRRNDTSKREESLKSKVRDISLEEVKEKKEIRDASVLCPDTKESGCQTRESLFQADNAPSSDGSGSNSRGFSTFGYSGGTIVRPSPPQTNTSELTIELMRKIPHQDSIKSQKKISDRRPMSTETTRSAPDVIIVSKPIR